MACQGIWQPKEEGLREICGVLEQHISPTPDKPRIWQHFQHYIQFPDFNNYLVFIFAHAQVLFHFIKLQLLQNHFHFKSIVLSLILFFVYIFSVQLCQVSWLFFIFCRLFYFYFIMIMM